MEIGRRGRGEVNHQTVVCTRNDRTIEEDRDREMNRRRRRAKGENEERKKKASTLVFHPALRVPWYRLIRNKGFYMGQRKDQ